MAGQRLRTGGSLPFLLYALMVLSFLFLCRMLIVYQAQFPRNPVALQTVLDAIGLTAMDALAVAVITLLTLAVSRLSAAAATLFMAVAAAVLMLAGAVNVGVMRVYQQPATINLLAYGDFLHIPGLLSLARYMSRADKLVIGLAVLLTASFALLPAVRKGRFFATRVAAWLLVPASCFALVALPLYGLVRGDGASRAQSANAAVRLAKSALAPPAGRAGEVGDPDLLDPFETYALSRDRWITSPARIRQANIRNVVIVVLESVGTDYVNPATTPNLSRLKADAAYFPNAFAPMPSSPMALFSLMTGMYPPVSPRAIPMVEPEFPATTLFESLGSTGRRTAVFSANWGFMDFGRYLKGKVDSLEEAPDERRCGRQGQGEACSFDSLKRWIGQSGQPFAAMLWTYRSHYPYGAEASQIAGNPQLARRLYLAGVRQTDRLIGELVAWLEAQDRLDETLLVVVGDHGEAFLQHGTLSHGNDIYQETVRVPLLLVNRRLFSGVTDTSPVRIIDVGPTVLSLARSPAPATFQGLDLSRALRPRRVFFAAAWLNLAMGFQEERMKYIYSYVTDRLQVFDIESDPRERTDLGPRLTPGERAAVIHRIMNWKAVSETKADAVRSSTSSR